MNFDMTIIKKLYSIGISAALNLALPSLFISLSRYVIVIIPAAYLFSRFVGANGVWYAFCFTEFVSAGFAALIYRKVMNGKDANKRNT